MIRRVLGLVWATSMALCAGPAVAAPESREPPETGVELGVGDTRYGFELAIGGGSVIAWDASDETGNAFGGLALVDIDDFAIGLGAAAVMPDSRLQGEFGAYWLEGRWSFLGRDALLSPYVVVGLGFATGDDFQAAGSTFTPARWSSSDGFIALGGAGLRFGASTGLYLDADVRAWNQTHLGISLSAGYRFF